MLYFLRFVIVKFWLYNILFCLYGCIVLYYVSYVCIVLYYKRIVLYDMVDYIIFDCKCYIVFIFCMDNVVL